MDVTTKNVKSVWRFNCVSDKKYVCKYEMAFYLSVFFFVFQIFTARMTRTLARMARMTRLLE